MGDNNGEQRMFGIGIGGDSLSTTASNSEEDLRQNANRLAPTKNDNINSEERPKSAAGFLGHWTKSLPHSMSNLGKEKSAEFEENGTKKRFKKTSLSGLGSFMMNSWLFQRNDSETLIQNEAERNQLNQDPKMNDNNNGKQLFNSLIQKKDEFRSMNAWMPQSL